MIVVIVMIVIIMIEVTVMGISTYHIELLMSPLPIV
jgi:hypothetical protein